MALNLILQNGLNVETLLILVAYIIVILVAIISHELGHGYMAYKNGDMTAKVNGRLSLNPANHLSPVGFIMMLLVGFGWAKPVPIDPRNFHDYKKGMLQTGFAGVTVNLIIAFISSICLAVLLKCTDNMFFYSKTPLFYFCRFLLYLFYFSMQINILLMVFNLLPIPPLDGFKIVETISEPDNKYVNFMYRYGNMVLIGFIVVSFMLNRMDGMNSLFGMVNDLTRLVFNKIWGAILGVTFG